MGKCDTIQRAICADAFKRPLCFLWRAAQWTINVLISAFSPACVLLYSHGGTSQEANAACKLGVYNEQDEQSAAGAYFTSVLYYVNGLPQLPVFLMTKDRWGEAGYLPFEEGSSGILRWYLSPISWEVIHLIFSYLQCQYCRWGKTALEQPVLLPICSCLCSLQWQTDLAVLTKQQNAEVAYAKCHDPCVLHTHEAFVVCLPLKFSGSRLTEMHNCVSCHMCTILENNI